MLKLCYKTGVLVINSINSCFYGVFGAASIGLGIGGAVLGAKVMLGGALVSAAALAIFAVVQNHQGSADEKPAKAEGPSYAMTFLTSASILGTGITGIILGSNALIIMALAVAVLSVIQSDMALKHGVERANKSFTKARADLMEVRAGANEISESQVEYEAALAMLLERYAILSNQIEKMREKEQASS